jgi:hypothetical protein
LLSLPNSDEISLSGLVSFDKNNNREQGSIRMVYDKVKNNNKITKYN